MTNFMEFMKKLFWTENLRFQTFCPSPLEIFLATPLDRNKEMKERHRERRKRRDEQIMKESKTTGKNKRGKEIRKRKEKRHG